LEDSLPRDADDRRDRVERHAGFSRFPDCGAVFRSSLRLGGVSLA
jgi:hypothetical protein